MPAKPTKPAFLWSDMMGFMAGVVELGARGVVAEPHVAVFPSRVHTWIRGIDAPSPCTASLPADCAYSSGEGATDLDRWRESIPVHPRVGPSR